MIHGHGDDLYRSEQLVKANFSTNVWYGADMELLRRVIAEKAGSVLNYPEPDAGSFKYAVAGYHRVNPENVLVGNGATELFYLIAHAFDKGQTIIPVPSFAEYEDACRLYGHQITFRYGKELENLSGVATLMFICNPNNPDGYIWDEKEIGFLLKTYPKMVLVVDESFIHFAPEARSVASWISTYRNLLVVRSMTKNYAIPGLRLGYLLGNPEIISFIGRYKQPWSVNALAIEIGKYLLQHADYFLPDPFQIMRRQQNFIRQLAAIPGFYPQISGASFFLVRTDYDSVRLKQVLRDKYNILIRDASNFRGLDNHYFRINTLVDRKNDLLITALKEYVE